MSTPPFTPSATAKHELADFVELVSWREGTISVVALNQLLSRLDEPDYSTGVPEGDDEIDDSVEGAFSEIERRIEACAGAYPFVVENEGQSVRFNANGNNGRHTIYLFLLLATRLNMNEQRRHGGLDGTKLFEEIGEQSAKSYLGTRAEGLVFGTAVGAGNFQKKVDELCRRLGEGDGFTQRSSGRPQDGKLDVVAWIPFSDCMPGKLILFGQCKTGTHYKRHLTQLQPDAFCNKWFRSQPALRPTRAFFVAEALSPPKWRDHAVDAGLLFDRCRIVDFSEPMDANVLARVRTWTSEAARANDLPPLP